jgi:hypothetical protein
MLLGADCVVAMACMGNMMMMSLMQFLEVWAGGGWVTGAGWVGNWWGPWTGVYVLLGADCVSHADHGYTWLAGNHLNQFAWRFFIGVLTEKNRHGSLLY